MATFNPIPEDIENSDPDVTDEQTEQISNSANPAPSDLLDDSSERTALRVARRRRTPRVVSSPYTSWTNARLRSELHAWGITVPASFAKKDLIKMLELNPRCGRPVAGTVTDNTPSDLVRRHEPTSTLSRSEVESTPVSDADSPLSRDSGLATTLLAIQRELSYLRQKVDNHPSLPAASSSNPSTSTISGPFNLHTASESTDNSLEFPSGRRFSGPLRPRFGVPSHDLPRTADISSSIRTNIIQDSEVSIAGARRQSTSGDSTRLFGNNPVLTAAVANLWNSAIAPSTSDSYRTGLNCFLRFASLSLLFPYAGLPDLTEDFLIYFVTHCHSILHLRFATIKLYLCGIRFAYLQAGKYSPLADADNHKLFRLSTICRAIRKQQGSATKPRLPITFHLLKQIVALLRSGVFSPFICLMFEAVCVVAFYGFLRCGEFTVKHSFDPTFNLCIGDISFVDHNQSVTILLKSSKTDPFRKGVPVILYANSSLCPISSLRKYLQSRTRIHHSLQDPLFVSDNHVALTRTVFISKLKLLLQTLNHNPTAYSGHSFRIGAATSAAQAHVPDHLIKTLGRWTSDSYSRYIRTPPTRVASAQRAMSLSDGFV